MDFSNTNESTILTTRLQAKYFVLMVFLYISFCFSVAKTQGHHAPLDVFEIEPNGSAI